MAYSRTKSAIAPRLIGAAAAAGALALAAGQAVGQMIGVNFAGSSYAQTNLIPPDPSGAAGDNYFVEFVKGRTAAYRKSDGALVSSSTDTAFWSSAGVSPAVGASLSYPRVVFDHASGRWFASAVDVIGGSIANTNNIYLAVSNSSDPTAGWHGFKVDPNNNFADFPTLGLDADGVYVSVNNFSTAGTYLNASVLSVPKSDLMLASPTIANRTLLDGLNGSNLGYRIQPAIDFGASRGHGTLLAMDLDAYSLINKTPLNNVKGPGSATLGTSLNIAVPTTSDPILARQPDGTRNLDTGDDSMSGSVVRVGNVLYAVSSLTLSSAAAVQWYKIDDTSGSLLQSGTIGDAAHDLSFPSISANANGDVVIAFTRTGSAAGEYASSYAVAGSTSNGTTTFGSPFALKNGSGTYHVVSGSGTNRWGLYSTSSLDPADPQIFWAIQPIASGTDQWSTQITEIIRPLPNEFRWNTAVSGALSLTGNWLNALAPVGALAPTADVVLSRATDPAGAGYTLNVDLPLLSNRSLSVRQGKVALDLGGFAYSLTSPSNSAPSLVVGPYGGSPRLTITHGTLNTVNAAIAPGAASNASVTLGGTSSPVTWNVSGALDVGGNATAAGGVGSLQVNGNAALVVSGMLTAAARGTISYNAGTMRLGGLKLIGGGKMTFAAGADKVLSTNSVSVDNVSQLDLADNDMIVHSTAATRTADVAALTALIGSGINRSGTLWTGPGIVSSAAAASARHTTAVGMLENDYGALGQTPGTIYTSFDGQSVGVNDILVKYTYFGDTDLNGQVNSNDYFQLDQGFLKARRGWANGDFDYDGAVTSDDYFLIDQAFTMQSGVLAPAVGEPAQAVAITAVPEPAALGGFAMGLMLTGRRRRRF